jgi:hypothetical protein
MNNNYSNWKKFQKTVLVGLLATTPILSQAAVISVEGETQFVGVLSGSFDEALADADGLGYLFDKPTMVVTIEQDGKKAVMALDLEQLAREHINVNGSGAKYSSLDNNAPRGIIQQLYGEATLGDDVKVALGYKDLNFDKRPSVKTLSRTMQENSDRLAERLAIEVSKQFGKTNVRLAIYDGKGRKAIDLSEGFEWSNVMSVQSGNLIDRISGLAEVEHDLGEIIGADSVKLGAAYAATQRSENDLDNAIRLSVEAQATLGGRQFAGLVQYIRHFTDSMEGMDSWMAQISTDIGKTTVYARGEITDIQTGSGKDKEYRGTLGAKRDLTPEGSKVRVTAIGEIVLANASSSRARETDLQGRLGLNVGAGHSFDTNPQQR